MYSDKFNLNCSQPAHVLDTRQLHLQCILLSRVLFIAYFPILNHSVSDVLYRSCVLWLYLTRLLGPSNGRQFKRIIIKTIFNGSGIQSSSHTERMPNRKRIKLETAREDGKNGGRFICDTKTSN